MKESRKACHIGLHTHANTVLPISVSGLLTHTHTLSLCLSLSLSRSLSFTPLMLSVSFRLSPAISVSFSISISLSLSRFWFSSPSLAQSLPCLGLCLCPVLLPCCMGVNLKSGRRVISFLFEAVFLYWPSAFEVSN